VSLLGRHEDDTTRPYCGVETEEPSRPTRGGGSWGVHARLMRVGTTNLSPRTRRHNLGVRLVEEV